MRITSVGLGITATLASLLVLSNTAPAVQAPSVGGTSSVDSDGDGLPDAEDPYPLIADPRMLSWYIVKIEIGWGIKTGSVVTAQEALTWGTEEADVQVQGDKTKILGEADASLSVGAKAELNANPLTAFGLLGAKASMNFQAKAGLSYTRDLDWSSTRRAESRRAADYLQKATSETRLDSPYIAVWIEFSNHSDRDLRLIPAPLPVYSGGRPVCNVSIAGAEDVGRDGILLPAKRDGVAREFKATLDTTGPLTQLLTGMESASPTVYLEKSSIVVRDAGGVDAVSLTKMIDGKTVPITLSAGGVANSWRVARMDEKTGEPVTLGQALESINSRLRTELNMQLLFSIEGGRLAKVAELPVKSEIGQWNLSVGGQERDPSNIGVIAQPIRAVDAVAVTFRDAESIITEELDRAIKLLDGTAGEREQGVAIVRALADRGVARAQNELGWCYKNGEGVAKDAAEGMRWYRKAAEQGDVDAQFNLGLSYYKGDGVSEDQAEAVRWFRKAAEQGDASAQYNLGVCYERGKGVAKDAVEAVRWYRKAAEQGLADAQNNLGTCYARGEGVPKDQAEGVRWYRKAAEQGLANAQNNLGARYATGEGVPKDQTEAVRWYRKAAEQGHATAQFNLAVSYDKGEGVAKDQAEAARWLRKAAEQGNTAAIKAFEKLGIK